MQTIQSNWHTQHAIREEVHYVRSLHLWMTVACQTLSISMMVMYHWHHEMMDAIQLVLSNLCTRTARYGADWWWWSSRGAIEPQIVGFDCMGGAAEVSDRLSWSRHFFVSTVMAGER